MWVSVLSLNKKQSSMYNKYACGCFLYAPSIFRTAKDGSGFIQERDLCYAQISSLSSCTRMYNCLTVYFKRLTERLFYYAATENAQRIRTDTDVRGSMQQRCFCGTKTRVQKCTRRYTSGQAIFKRLTASLFLM